MTDEQKFEEWLDAEYKYLIEDTEGNIINITKKVREAYLAGLLEGKLDKIEELEKEIKRLTELLNRSNARLAEEQLKNAELRTEVDVERKKEKLKRG